MIKQHIYILGFFAVFIALLSAASYAQAQSVVDILPAKAVKDKNLLPENITDTHPPIKLTPDKSELIRLNEKAGSIIIGNADHLSVLADNAKTLILVPKVLGATYITVLDTNGNVLMQRHVIIGHPKEKYVRIRKSCAGVEEGECQATQVYYCPDMCHQVLTPQDVDEDESAAGDLSEAGQGQPPQNDTANAQDTDE